MSPLTPAGAVTAVYVPRRRLTRKPVLRARVLRRLAKGGA
ncbi:MAG: hypothetical protein QOI78_9591 [Actinomycetota bacterium]|nr:hypothetical protein [Actinomycetota bacterium]